MTKQMIMDVAAVLFFQRGYTQTSLDDIAKALSITKPSLYYRFQSKEEIVIACLETSYRAFQDALAQQDNPALPARTRVEVFLRIYLELISGEMGANLLMVDTRLLPKKAKDLCDDYRRIFNEKLESLIRLGHEDGSIAAPEHRIISYAIFGMFNWISRWRARKRGPESETILACFFSIIFDGIAVQRPELAIPGTT